MLSRRWGARTSADEMKMARIMAQVTTQPLWMDWLLRNVNTGKKKSKTMRTAIREHERKWIVVASALRRMSQQRTSEQELMQWFIEFVITDMYVINSLTALIVIMRSPTAQCHLSTLGCRHSVERGDLAPACRIIRRWHQSPNITLMQMSDFGLGSVLRRISSLWDAQIRVVTASDQLGDGHYSKSTVNTVQIWTLIIIIINIIIIIIHATIIIIIIM